MRRSRLDIRLGRALTIDQRWQNGEGGPWRVRQVHRVDCVAELERGPERRTVRFATLRSDWSPMPQVGA